LIIVLNVPSTSGLTAPAYLIIESDHNFLVHLSKVVQGIHKVLPMGLISARRLFPITQFVGQDLK
jgi:hypothetical protein